MEEKDGKDGKATAWTFSTPMNRWGDIRRAFRGKKATTEGPRAPTPGNMVIHSHNRTLEGIPRAKEIPIKEIPINLTSNPIQGIPALILKETLPKITLK
jgi:hypothetical protein